MRGSPSPRFCWDGLALGAVHLFRADGIFDLHFAPGEPPLVADRTALQRGRALPDLQRDHADVLPAVDGQEATRLAGHGREILE